MSFAISIFDGELGYSTKAGFIRFTYDEMIQWAKAQGRNSPYKRLYTARTPYRRKTVRRKSERSICDRLHWKSQCRCQIVVYENDEFRRAIYPTDREIRQWKVSEYCRKKKKLKVGMWRCPRCPKSKGFCVLYPSAGDIETLRKQKMEALGANEESLPPTHRWPFCSLTSEHFVIDPTKPDFDALCDWFDLGGNTDVVLLETGLIPDVPLLPPDEPYAEYDPEEFYRLFGYELPEDYVPVDESNTPPNR